MFSSSVNHPLWRIRRLFAEGSSLPMLELGTNGTVKPLPLPSLGSQNGLLIATLRFVARDSLIAFH